MKIAARLLVAGVLLAAASAAPAQTVYRCGNEYTRVPCTGGTSVETNGSATAAARAEADRTAVREHRLGDQMERDRLRNERAHKPAMAANLGPRKTAAPSASASASHKPKKKARARIRVVEGDDFIARVPGAKPK